MDKHYYLYMAIFVLAVAGYLGFEKYLEHEEKMASIQSQCVAEKLKEKK